MPVAKLRLVLWAAFTQFTASAAASGVRPNFLFLFADDQRADTIGAWGNRHIQTPHLDQLLRRGFSFRQNYCAGANSGAVCIPSRAMLMSGRTWFHVDHALTNAPVILPELFRQNGYRTFATGKWHNQPASWRRGFEQGKSVFFGGMEDHTKVTVQDAGPDGQFTKPRTAAKFSSEEFADAAIEFLRSPAGPQPFFCYVAFTAPHDPRNPPESFRQLYYKQRPPLPPNFLPQHPFDNSMGGPGMRDENLAPWPRTPAIIGDQLCEYYGLITHLDSQVGRVLQALKASPHAGNTVVIYAADHGLALGSHGLLGKQSIYEHSMRCPLIIAGPGIPAGKSSQAFTYLLDLFPTLCDVAGLRVPAGLDGFSLRPIWEGRSAQVRDSIFLAYSDLMRSVRADRWKLLVYPKINYEQLFDLKKDPHETRNLAVLPAHKSTQERLHRLLVQEQIRHDDPLDLTSAIPLPRYVDYTGALRKPDQWQPEWIVKKYFSASQPARDR